MVARDKKLVVLPHRVMKYVDPDRNCPFDISYVKLRIPYQAAIDQSLRRVEDGEGVKVKAYSRIGAIVLTYPAKIRIYYGLHDDRTILLFVGTEKRQNKDIKKAQEDWDEFSEDVEKAENAWQEYLESIENREEEDE